MATPLLHAGAKTDGTAGAIQSFTGKFTIPQTLGVISGANLFHSFQNFSVNSGESATFTTTGAFQNVISRVTGGVASDINGLLKLDAAAGSAPNFFFINPAGVTFGAGAAVDVPGAFHISTADYLRFPGGATLYADPGKSSSLSTAAPEAFGFLGANRAAITVKDGAALTMLSGQSISLIAGDITIDNANVATVGGNIRMAAVGQAAQEIGSAGALPAATGKLNIQNGGLIAAFNGGAANSGQAAVSAGDIVIDAAGNPNGAGIISLSTAAGNGNGGAVSVLASGNLTLQNGGQILSNTELAGNAGNLDVSVAGTLSIVKLSSISSNTSAGGNAGVVKINAGSVAIDGQGGAAGIASESTGAGNSGDVTVTTAGTLAVLGGGKISSSTFATGTGGLVKVDAGSVTLDGRGAAATGIVSEAGASGNAGNVTISTSGNLAILNQARVSSSAFKAGNAGPVKLSAASITIDGQNSTGSTGIFSNANGTGNAGTLDVNTNGQLSILNGQITSSTTAAGKGGAVTVNAGGITASNSANSTGTGIASESGGSGNAGSVAVTASGNLSLTNGARISSSTFSSGAAGAVNVNAGSISLSGANPGGATSILSETYGSGNAGTVDVSAAGNLSILDQAVISSSALGAGNGGAVRVHADSISIDKQGGVNRTGIGSVAFSGTGNGGSVDVVANGSLSLQNGGEISSNTSTVGIAGSVHVAAAGIAMGGGSSINSGATAGSSGQTGNVAIAASKEITLSGADFSIQNNATVGSTAAKLITPSTLTVSAPRITLENAQITASSTGNIAASNIVIQDSELLAASRLSAITTSAVSGKGGSISIQSGGALLLDHSRITTSVTGVDNGDGGPITINAPVIALNTGFIQANTAVAAARGGDVSINADAPDSVIISSGHSLITGGLPLAFDPARFAYNVIQAARPDGVNGEIRIASPQIDLSGTLASLSTQLIDFGNLGTDLCRIGSGSSLTPLGRGGLLPASSGRVRPSF